MRCKNDGGKSYRGDEPSPKGLGYCAHAERLGASREGLDGEAWVVAADRNGRLAWRRKGAAEPLRRATRTRTRTRTGSDAANGLDAAQERCIRDFAFFRKKTSSNSWEVMYGQRVDKGDGQLWLQTEDDRAGKPRLVPRGFVRKPISRGALLGVYCQPTVDRAGLRASGALEWYEWERASRRLWLTIADLERLGAGGRPVVVLSMHRNLGDVCADESVNPRGKAVAPARFFRNAKATFVRSSAPDELKGRLLLADMGGESFEIGPDVEYKKDAWYPLEEGELPAKDPQAIFGLLGKRVPWRQLPRGTHVGYRGPMMLWSDLGKMPKVWYE